MGCLFIHKLCRVDLAVLVENYPWGAEVFKSLYKNLVDVSSFLDEVQDIQSGVFDCG